ncbi:hypothetical protein TSMEX_007722, partial [Taenia solium]
QRILALSQTSTISSYSCDLVFALHLHLSHFRQPVERFFCIPRLCFDLFPLFFVFSHVHFNFSRQQWAEVNRSHTHRHTRIQKGDSPHRLRKTISHSRADDVLRLTSLRLPFHSSFFCTQ